MRWIIVIFVLDLFLWVGGEKDVTGWLQSIVKSSHQEIAEWHGRSKRSLLNFQNVIQCIQPWASIISTYGDYGCYCGYKGNGRPLDDTDKCCYNHDQCYGDGGGMLDSYFSSYSFDCINNRVICRDDLNTANRQSFCECDRIAAECFLSNRKSYTSKLYNINTKKYCSDKPDLHDLHTNQHILSKLYTCDLQLDHDRCCVDKGYNSAYEMCCGGNIVTLPRFEKENMHCCGGTLYDSRSKICCHGFLHRNFPHIKCCGNSGAKVDMTIEICDNDEPKLKTDKEN